MPTAKLMTNLLPRYYDFLEQEANSQHKTKREIIEEAIRLYMQKKKTDSIRNAYKAMATDVEYLDEMQAISEEGVEYFLIELDEC